MRLSFRQFLALALLVLISGCGKPAQNQAQKTQDNFTDTVQPEQRADATTIPSKPAHIAFTPSQIDFGDLRPGDGGQRAATLTNDGQQPLATPNIHSSVQPPFELHTDCTSSPTLLPGHSCSVTVAILPTIPGHYQGQIAVSETTNASLLPIAATVVQPPAPPVQPHRDDTVDLLRRKMLDGYTVPKPVSQISRQPVVARIQDSAERNGWTPTIASLPVTNFNRTILRYTPIPAKIFESVDSELGCLVTAIVDSDIFAYRRLARPLIGKGSRVEGNCTSNAIDQDRIAVIWTRLITVDDRIVNLSAPSMDAIGRTGIPATIYDPFWSTLGKSLLISMLSNGGGVLIAGNGQQTSVNTATGSTTTITTPAQQAVQNIAADVSAGIAQAIGHQTRVQQIRLLLAPGQDILIYPTNDITFPEEMLLPAEKQETDTLRPIPPGADDPDFKISTASSPPLSPNAVPYLNQPQTRYGALVLPGTDSGGGPATNGANTLPSSIPITRTSEAAALHPAPGVTVSPPSSYFVPH